MASTAGSVSRFYDIDAILAQHERIPVRWLTNARGLGFLRSGDQQSGPRRAPGIVNCSAQHGGLLSATGSSAASVPSLASPTFHGDNIEGRNAATSTDSAPAIAVHDDIVQGTKMELPVWMMYRLSAEGYVAALVPRCMSRESLQRLEASADDLNPVDHSPYFYELSSNVVSCLQHMEELDMAGVLPETALAETGAVDWEHLKTVVQRTFIDRFKTILRHSGNVQRDKRSGDFSRLMARLTNVERDLYDKGRRGAEEYGMWKAGKLGTHSSIYLAARRGVARRDAADPLTTTATAAHADSCHRDIHERPRKRR